MKYITGKSLSGTAGFSLIEVIVTMAIIGIMVGTGSMYYSDVMNKANEDKALSDLKQICKVLADFDSTLPQGLTTYTQISADPELRDLYKLVEERKMASMPDDPWGNYYRIDIQAGIIYSQGRDFGDSFDYYRYTVDPTHVPPLPLGVEDSISEAQDDIIVRFRPQFKPTNATAVNTVRSGKEVTIVSVAFSRPVDSTFLTTDSSFQLQEPGASAPPLITTAIVNVAQRHKVNLILDDTLPDSANWTVVTSSDGTIRAVDQTELENNYTLDIIKAPTY